MFVCFGYVCARFILNYGVKEPYHAIVTLNDEIHLYHPVSE